MRSRTRTQTRTRRPTPPLVVPSHPDHGWLPWQCVQSSVLLQPGSVRPGQVLQLRTRPGAFIHFSLSEAPPPPPPPHCCLTGLFQKLKCFQLAEEYFLLILTRITVLFFLKELKIVHIVLLVLWTMNRCPLRNKSLKKSFIFEFYWSCGRLEPSSVGWTFWFVWVEVERFTVRRNGAQPF